MTNWGFHVWHGGYFWIVFNLILAFSVLTPSFLKPFSFWFYFSTFYWFVNFFVIFKIVFGGFAVNVSIDGNNGTLTADAIVYTFQRFHWSIWTSHMTNFQNSLLWFCRLQCRKILLHVLGWCPFKIIFNCFEVISWQIWYRFISIMKSWWFWLYWLI